MRSRVRIAAVALVVLALSSAGAGAAVSPSSTPTATVTGTVTLNGAPFSGGKVPFGSLVDLQSGRHRRDYEDYRHEVKKMHHFLASGWSAATSKALAAMMKLRRPASIK